jgi:cation:H+ antiporter
VVVGVTEIIVPIATALGSLLIILLGCELFTNGIEWFGCRMKLGAGAVGSVLAAVGTALPETAVPLVAILINRSEAAREIGVGAILGAPFMLSTLAFTVTAIAVSYHALRKRRSFEMTIDAKVVGQDLRYFFVVYIAAVMSSLLPWHPAKLGVAVALFGCYSYYVWLKLRGRVETATDELADLHFCRWAENEPGMHHIVSQLIVSLAAIMFAAHFFVKSLETLGPHVGITPLLLSMIVTPVATELPEKFNSVIWVGRGKDTLAMGNITGAMVFQSCIPVTVGLIGTEWSLDVAGWTSATVALVSSAIVYAVLKWKRKLDARVLLVGLPLYIIFIVIAMRAAGG